MNNFKDWIGIYFLGNEYNRNIWNKIYPDSYSFKIFSVDEKISDNIFNICRSSLFKQINMKEAIKNLDISSETFKATIDLAFFESDKKRKNKVIDQAILISYSTGLKFISALKLQYIKKVAQSSGWTIKKLKIAFIDKNIKNKFRECKFKFSNSFNISNDKREDDDSKTLIINDYLENQYVARFPINNKGSSQKYLERSVYHFKKSDNNFFKLFEAWENKKTFIAPSLAEFKVRANDSRYWIINKDLNKKEDKGEISTNNFQVLNKILLNEYSKKLGEYHKRVYFDFETISMPFASFNNTKAYQKVPVQYSIIKTDNKNNIISIINKIFNFEEKNKYEEFFKNMVKNIHENYAIYIAHNKIFEDGCLINGLSLLSYSLDKSELAEIETYVDKIVSSKHSMDTSIVFKKCFNFFDFPGKYSLKILSKWFHAFRSNLILKYSILDYDFDLDIKNGKVAQEELIYKYFGFEEKDQMNNENLIKYCENDVRIMLLLVDFILMNKS